MRLQQFVSFCASGKKAIPIQRRAILKALLSLPAISFFFTRSGVIDLYGEVIKSKPLNVPTGQSDGTFYKKVTCTFPRDLTFEQFTEVSRSWTKPDFIPTVDVEYAQLGLLQGIDRETNKRFVSWTYRFKDLEAFSNWTTEVSKHQVFDHTKIEPGFKYSFEYLNLANKQDPKLYFSQNYPLHSSNLENHKV